MSNIDKRAQKELYAKVEQQAHSLRGSPREYQALTGLCPVNVIEMHAQKIQALLDELEAADNNLIDSECHVAELEEALRDKQALLEASEQRIAELESLTALQLTRKSLVVPDEMTPKQASSSYCGEVRGYRDGWNACRAAMLQCADDSIAHEGKNRPEDKLGMVDHFGGSNNMVEPVTDNTNQQFESLSRGDK